MTLGTNPVTMKKRNQNFQNNFVTKTVFDRIDCSKNIYVKKKLIVQ